MARYTKKDADGRYYIESVNGRLESNIYGHTYGEAIDRFAELENADVAPKSEISEAVEKIVSATDKVICEAKAEVAGEIIDDAIRAVYSKIDMKIYNTIDGKPLGDHVAYGKQMAMYDVISLLAELKKKYTGSAASEK